MHLIKRLNLLKISLVVYLDNRRKDITNLYFSYVILKIRSNYRKKTDNRQGEHSKNCKFTDEMFAFFDG